MRRHWSYTAWLWRPPWSRMEMAHHTGQTMTKISRWAFYVGNNYILNCTLTTLNQSKQTYFIGHSQRIAVIRPRFPMFSVFPRIPTVPHFPALPTGHMFSRGFYLFHIFPRTCFPAFSTCSTFFPSLSAASEYVKFLRLGLVGDFVVGFSLTPRSRRLLWRIVLYLTIILRAQGFFF